MICLVKNKKLGFIMETFGVLLLTFILIPVYVFAVAFDILQERQKHG